jgi:hypothetical protein
MKSFFSPVTLVVAVLITWTAPVAHAFSATRPRGVLLSTPSSTRRWTVQQEEQVEGKSTSSLPPPSTTAAESRQGVSPAIAKRSDLDKGPAKKMDQAIFNFNKLLIDSVYDLICLLYPVRGTERDFARFYVLETVARVPYFAYLSVLHLREVRG